VGNCYASDRAAAPTIPSFRHCLLPKRVLNQNTSGEALVLMYSQSAALGLCPVLGMIGAGAPRCPRLVRLSLLIR